MLHSLFYKPKADVLFNQVSLKMQRRFKDVYYLQKNLKRKIR